MTIPFRKKTKENLFMYNINAYSITIYQRPYVNKKGRIIMDNKKKLTEEQLENVSGGLVFRGRKHIEDIDNKLLIMHKDDKVVTDDDTVSEKPIKSHFIIW